jgi:hypothetical protein
MREEIDGKMDLIVPLLATALFWEVSLSPLCPPPGNVLLHTSSVPSHKPTRIATVPQRDPGLEKHLLPARGGEHCR